MFWKTKQKEDKLQSFVEQWLRQVVDSGTDKAIFGEPCDSLPRESLAAAKAANPKWGRAMDRFDGLEDEFPDVFGPKPKKVLEWWRIGGVWQEMVGIPWYLLHEFVRRLGDMIVLHQPRDLRLDHSQCLEAVVPVDLGRNRGTVDVKLTLTIEPNSCYSVTLKKIS